MWRTDDGTHVVSGCLHMHTTFSDGSGEVRELVEAAQAVGLDYLIITDHMDLRARSEAGRHGSLQIMVGYEHHDRRSHNHYLALGTAKVLSPDLEAEQVVHDVRAEGGVGIVAHPEERRAHMRDLPPYPWTAWSSHEFDGLEVWNQMSEWTEHLTRWNRFTRVWSPRKSLRGPSDRLLYLWDVLNTKRPTAGVAGVDAHAHPYRLGPLTIPIFPYKVHFRTLQTHLLMDTEPPSEPAAFSQAVLAALRDCRIYFSSERWGATAGFRLRLENRHGHTGIGGRLKKAPGTRLHASWPGRADYQVVYNGFPAWRGRGHELSLELAQAGAYRLALYKRGRGWLFTNHFRLVDA